VVKNPKNPPPLGAGGYPAGGMNGLEDTYVIGVVVNRSKSPPVLGGGGAPPGKKGAGDVAGFSKAKEMFSF